LGKAYTYLRCMKGLEKLMCGIGLFAIALFFRQGVFAASTTKSATPAAPHVAIIEKVKVLETLPHDATVFVQGLEFHEGHLFESGGLYGRSLLRRYNVTTGKDGKRISIEAQYFAEGLTIFNNKIYLLTWKEQVVFQFDMEFRPTKQFHITTEGWGLTHDESHLIYSDGSERLYFVSPTTFQVIRILRVMERLESGSDVAVLMLNELEYVGDYIYANVWMTNDIVIVDPLTGYLVKRLRCTTIANQATKAGGDVLNGIALDSVTNALYVTGKLWPTIHRIQLPSTTF